MKLFAIYGNPVSHSRSPLMHNKVFKDLHFPACYTRIKLEDGSKLKEDFFARKLDGANVTVPHKEAAFEACDEVRGFANTVGVVNTLVNVDGKLIGYNTDADGFIFAMQAFSDVKSILVLGAGGTSKALTQKFIDEGFETTVVNRSENRLESFKGLGCQVATWESVEVKAYDLIVNTTSAGLEDENYPAPLELLEQLVTKTSAMADAIYGKKTPFLKLAQKHNIPNIDGQAMLIGQGVLGNELFTQGKLEKSKILEAMQKSFEL